MIASELLRLNTSKVGSTEMRPKRNVLATFKSSWVMRSTCTPALGTRATVIDVWFATDRGTTTVLAGHGAAQTAGYRVVPVVNVITRLLVAGMLLCSAALNVTPHGSG